MLRIAYCGYDYYSNCLSALLSRDDVQVLKIYACGEGANRRYSKEVIRLAKAHKIPFQFKPISQKEIDRLFDMLSCDYILSAGYSYKIPIGNHRGLNIHPTLLPIGRGAWPFPMIILNGYQESGVTIHKLTDKFDAGDIVLQRSFPINAQETQDTLHCKNQMLGAELLKEWLEKPEELWESAVPQDEDQYQPAPQKSERTVFPELTVDQASRIIRAYGTKGVYVQTAEGLFAVGCSSCQKIDHSQKTGSIILYHQGNLVTAIKDGFFFGTCARRVTSQRALPLTSRVWRKVRKTIGRIR